MLRMVLLFLISCASTSVFAQQGEFYTVNADSSIFTLTSFGASHFASLPLKCIHQEYPNKTDHIAANDTDQLMTPRQMHPSFYGCFDWHSCVHGHWMLVRLLKQFPNIENAKDIRDAISKNITPDNISQEVKYFNGPNSKIFERTYGWAWLLKLQSELLTWNDAEGGKWRSALMPLCDTIVQRWQRYLPKQTYPIRSGVHGNTAFGLIFALDYARTAHDTSFERSIVKTAKRLYIKDKMSPANWEPNGADFLSPSLEEADLMRRLLDKNEFVKWFKAWLPISNLKHLTELPVVSDRSDLLIVHLDGLCFSRAWCMSNIARQLPVDDPARKILIQSAANHLKTGLSSVASGNYSGEHWLASFAIYALNNN